MELIEPTIIEFQSFLHASFGNHSERKQHQLVDLFRCQMHSMNFYMVTNSQPRLRTVARFGGFPGFVAKAAKNMPAQTERMK